MCERYIVLSSSHLLILSVDRTKKALVYEVKRKKPFVCCIRVHIQDFLNVSVLIALACTKWVPTLSALRRGRLRMEQTRRSYQPRQRHFTEFSGALLRSTVAHNSPFFSIIWTQKWVCSRDWKGSASLHLYAYF